MKTHIIHKFHTTSKLHLAHKIHSVHNLRLTHTSKISLFAILATAAAAVATSAISTSVSAWGPERDTYTMEAPASSATFNSITNNPTIGDERDFVRVGQINADVTDLTNEAEILPGHQYLVYIYYHNDASATYNGPEYHNVGVAFKSRISTTFPTILAPKESGTVSATITAENTTPLSVWDEATFVNNTGDKLVLNYVLGSAKIYNDWKTNGSVLSTNLFSEEGTLIGVNSLNGIVLGCDEYHGVVSYVVEARALSGSLEKTVSTDGTNFSDSATTTPGSVLTFRLTMKNTGDIGLTNTTIQDSLPDGLTLVPGSVTLTANDSGVYDPLTDDIISTGFNLGRIGLGNTVTITYQAKAADDIDCPGVVLTNTATMIYDSDETSGESRTASAKITIERSGCGETPITPPVDGPAEELPDEIVNTGPLEIVMAVIIVIAIAGVGFYFWRTHFVLRSVKNEVSGKSRDLVSRDHNQGSASRSSSSENHDSSLRNHDSAKEDHNTPNNREE